MSVDDGRRCVGFCVRDSRRVGGEHDQFFRWDLIFFLG